MSTTLMEHYDLLFENTRHAEASLKKEKDKSTKLEQQLRETKLYYENLLQMSTKEYRNTLQEKQRLENLLKSTDTENQKASHQASIYLTELKKIKNQYESQRKFWDTCFDQMKNETKKLQLEHHTLKERLEASERQNAELLQQLKQATEEKLETEKQAVHYRTQLQKVLEKLEFRLSQTTLMRNQITELESELQKLQNESKTFRFKIIEAEALKKELETLQEQVMDAEKEHRLQFGDNSKRYQEYIQREIERLNAKETKLSEIVHNFHKLKNAQEQVYNEVAGTGKKIRMQAMQHIEKLQGLLKIELENKAEIEKKILKDSIHSSQEELERLREENTRLKVTTTVKEEDEAETGLSQDARSISNEEFEKAIQEEVVLTERPTSTP